MYFKKMPTRGAQGLANGHLFVQEEVIVNKASVWETATMITGFVLC
jgi:hypothetical protein